MIVILARKFDGEQVAVNLSLVETASAVYSPECKDWYTRITFESGRVVDVVHTPGEIAAILRNA